MGPEPTFRTLMLITPACWDCPPTVKREQEERAMGPGAAINNINPHTPSSIPALTTLTLTPAFNRSERLSGAF